MKNISEIVNNDIYVDFNTSLYCSLFNSLDNSVYSPLRDSLDNAIYFSCCYQARVYLYESLIKQDTYEKYL